MSAHRAVHQHRRHRIFAVVTGVLTCAALAGCGSSAGSPATRTNPAAGHERRPDRCTHGDVRHAAGERV